MKTYVVMLHKSIWYSLDVNDFSDYQNYLPEKSENTLITFQKSDLIRFIKKKGMQLYSNIIDLQSFDKQMSQEGKEFRDNKKWKALSFLRHHKIIDSSFKLSKLNFKQVLEHIATLYVKLVDKDHEEASRFNEIEIKINSIINNRQYKGIAIDLDLAERKSAELEKEIYALKNKLQLNHRVFDPDNEEFQRQYFKEKGFVILQSYLDTFKAHKKNDEVSNLIYKLIRTTRDFNSILYILSQWGGKEKTYSDYLGFGTITSRIIQRQPSFQNLKKENRDLIIPERGKRLFYIDYSQFEAGILASLSKDLSLIALYNTDIYSDLAEKALGDKSLRDDAKILFYRYMYGDDTISDETKAYFKNFEELEKFRAKIEQLIKDNGRVGTENGNYRYMLEEDSKWYLSHVIQATASLIYKNAVIRVNNEVKDAEFLIPMHDATLYQVQTKKLEEVKTKVETIYKEVFQNICPEITPRVTLKDKFE